MNRSKKRKFFTNSNFYFVRQRPNGELQILNGTEEVKDTALLIWVCGGKDMLLKELVGNHIFRFDTYKKLTWKRVAYRRRKHLPI